MPTLKLAAAPVQKNDRSGRGPDHADVQRLAGKWAVPNTPSTPEKSRKSQKVEQSGENRTVKYCLSDLQRSTRANLTALYEH